MVNLETLRAERRDEIIRLAERRGAHSLRVFGSVARGEANDDSDLDLLVAWESRAGVCWIMRGWFRIFRSCSASRSTSEPRNRFTGTYASGSFERRRRFEG